MVVIPGRTRAAVASSTCRTIRPARRILSISADDLQTIAIPVDGLQHVLGHLFRGPVAVDFHQTTRLAVIVLHRLSLGIVGVQPFLDDLFVVIMTNFERRTVCVANAGNLGRLEVDVVDPTAGGTRTTSGEPLYQ